MAIENKSISVSELDFDLIKANIKNYLKGQTEFQDYDFEGSGMSVLLDVLAYNTHYNALYTNLAVNEMFLDSARKRNSVVSIAKMLGYVPNSATAPKAVVNITVSNPTDNPPTLTLPEKTSFTTSVDGRTYSFYNLDAKTITPTSNGVYVFENVFIYEGTPLSFSYEARDETRYILPNKNVDLSKLRIRALEDPILGKYFSYAFAENLTEVNSDTRVYYIKEIDDELFEVEFGDGVLGKKPATGSKVILDYFITNKTVANKARTFNYNGDNTFGGVITVTTIEPAADGAEPENIDSIKYNAPKSFAAQNRAVTSEDYRSVIQKIYPNIDSISVWGGETNVPPIYGKVFIAIKPTSGEFLTPLTKLTIQNSLKSRNTVSITPEVVDPFYLYVDVNTTVYYDVNATTNDSNTISAIVRNAIDEYNETELGKFDGVFRFSKLGRIIDAAEPSILSNITSITLRRDVIPAFNRSSRYVVRLDNPIFRELNSEDHVLSTGFNILGRTEEFYLSDDGNGNMRLFYYAGSKTLRVYLDNTAGTVDYDNGVITINSIYITAAPNNKVSFIIIPLSNDVVSVRNQLVLIDRSITKVNAIIDSIVSGSQAAGSSEYIFTPSR
jgi:uncharacterized protein YqfB (UPF0267 family)